MRYGKWFTSYELSPLFLSAVEDFVRQRAREASAVESPGGNTRRRSDVVWIREPGLLSAALEIAKVANKDAGWDFDLDVVEPLQYTEYSPSDEYGWHTDQAEAPYPDMRVRKVSFSVFLNDDFEGGQFDLEVYGPNVEQRALTFEKLKPGTALFFQSHLWHRVRPITSGLRKSLVGWVLGTRFR
jgi:PKHD-type hydroxylase